LRSRGVVRSGDPATMWVHAKNLLHSYSRRQTFLKQSVSSSLQAQRNVVDSPRCVCIRYTYMPKPHRPDISWTSSIVLFKFLLFGGIAAESWFFGMALARPILIAIDHCDCPITKMTCVAVIFGLVLLYAYYRDVQSKVMQIAQSKRADLLIVFLAGIAIPVHEGGLFHAWYVLRIEALPTWQAGALTAAPILVGCILCVNATIRRLINTQNPKSMFINDKELESKGRDLLSASGKADRFAECVFNNGSRDSLVFGIDAPWGHGKSTFINFCKEYWSSQYRNEVIVYDFNPLRFEQKSQLLEKLTEGLIEVLQAHMFLPELGPLISRYSRLSRGTGKVSFFGFDLELMSGTASLDRAFDDLERVLSTIPVKIVVIIDDLDRLNVTAIKEILFAIKKSFMLPNISYVLCYDTQNIADAEHQGNDVDKTSEFLQKFVNFKISLYLDGKALMRVISTEMEQLLASRSESNPFLVSQAVDGLKTIIESLDFYRYLTSLGDLRKLKRLLNTVTFLELEKIDFDNYDINKTDLIHLLLLYIYYPHVFRTIYATETEGKCGFFSLVGPYDEGYPTQELSNASGDHKLANSTHYSAYLKTLGRNEQFLLDKLFSVANLPPDFKDDGSSVEIHTLACFNQKWLGSRNLEQYLNLIVKTSIPPRTSQQKFYLNQLQNMRSGKTLEEVFSQEEFSRVHGDEPHQQLWRVIVNNMHDLPSVVGHNAIRYLKNNIHRYPVFTRDSIAGIRDDLAYFLAKLLDRVGWCDENGLHHHNSDENIRQIAEWVFGDGRHVGDGILDSLIRKEYGVLGLFDALLFRLSCNVDRGGDVHNLARALAYRGDANAPTTGRLSEILIAEMRGISQHLFSLFTHLYINPRRNILEEVDKLTYRDLMGDWADVSQGINESSGSELQNDLSVKRSSIIQFICYQIGGEVIEQGVCCGYYDEAGFDDQKGIAKAFRGYLFDVCFEPKSGDTNYERFLDFLLMQFALVHSLRDRKFVPRINALTKVLGKEPLAKYWQEHRTTIMAREFTSMPKEVVTANYRASYSDLKMVFDELDSLLSDEEPKQPVHQ
jgi:hypothetical protein